MTTLSLRMLRAKIDHLSLSKLETKKKQDSMILWKHLSKKRIQDKNC